MSIFPHGQTPEAGASQVQAPDRIHLLLAVVLSLRLVTSPCAGLPVVTPQWVFSLDF